MTTRLFLVGLLVAGCGGKIKHADGPADIVRETDDDDAKPTKEIDLEPLRIEVTEDDRGNQTTTATDARTLLEDGNDWLMQGRYPEAIAAYDKIIYDFPDSQLVVAALYNSGIAFERDGKPDEAIARYRNALDRAQGSQEAIDVHFRLAHLLSDIHRYPESETEFMTVLERDDLSALDRIEALGQLGYVRLEQKDYVGAEETLRAVLEYHRDVKDAEHLDAAPYFVVMAQYYLAAIPQRQFEVVPLRYPEEQMAKDLDHKSELFLLARDRYVKAAEYGNLYWTSGSLYQLGMMYRRFWDDFMRVPVPSTLEKLEAEEYVKLVNENQEIRKLLEKALLYHEKNIDLGRSVANAPHWMQDSIVAAAEIKDLMARQQKGELFMPGSVPKPIIADPDPTNPEGTEYIPARPDL